MCNDPHNCGELTLFAEMFLDIVRISMQQLLDTLKEKKLKWNYYQQYIPQLPNAEKPDVSTLYELLIQAALFSSIGISREQLIQNMELSENTVRSRLKAIPESLLIENRQRGRKYYLLDLDEVDRLVE